MTTAGDPPQLGPLIQRHRKVRRLTLDQLAAASGVSRSMLSQIERGEANPTFSTLWSVTRALNLELSELIGGETSRGDSIDVVPRHATPEIRTGDGRCILTILSPVQMAGNTEWYLLRVEPGGELKSDPHARGTREHLTLLEGALSVEGPRGLVDVPEGATARYAADVAHCIRNAGPHPARALLVVVMP
jgi:DNA-binding XRE family transcriptional regulator